MRIFGTPLRVEQCCRDNLPVSRAFRANDWNAAPVKD